MNHDKEKLGLPWSICKKHGDTIYNDDDEICWTNTKIDAEFILDACNTYHKSRELIEELINELELGSNAIQRGRMVSKARKFLKGETK